MQAMTFSHSRQSLRCLAQNSRIQKSIAYDRIKLFPGHWMSLESLYILNPARAAPICPKVQTTFHEFWSVRMRQSNIGQKLFGDLRVSACNPISYWRSYLYWHCDDSNWLSEMWSQQFFLMIISCCAWRVTEKSEFACTALIRWVTARPPCSSQSAKRFIY